MIKYRLRCENGHTFDEWFTSISDYDNKQEKQELSCPECQSSEISKAIMAPAIDSSGGMSKQSSRISQAAENFVGSGNSSCNTACSAGTCPFAQ